MNKRAIDSANDLMIDLIAVAALQPWNISETHRVLLPCRTVGGRVLGQNSRRHLSRYRVITFLFAVTLLSSLAALLDSRGLFGHAGTLVYMWCPGLAAIIASLLTARSLKDIGWTTRPKWLALGWLIPVAYASLAYGLVWITGLGGVPSATFLQRARLTFNMPTRPDWMVIAASFGFISVLLLLPSMISALGEEIGWRGFLVPELSNWLGPRTTCLISGVIWAAWHGPALLHGYGGTGTPKLYQVACFTAMVLCSATVMAWLRMRSDSVWPAALAHATHNAVIQLFFDHITAMRTWTPYLIGEFGCAMLLGLIPLAWYCMRNLSLPLTVGADHTPMNTTGRPTIPTWS